MLVIDFLLNRVGPASKPRVEPSGERDGAILQRSGVDRPNREEELS